MEVLKRKCKDSFSTDQDDVVGSVMPPLQSCPLASRVIQGRRVSPVLSSGCEDQAWDEFLRAILQGQFQQSSLWSQFKRSEGWKCSRVTLLQKGRIVGGFQMLWRETRLGRVGNVSKGPVLAPDAADLESFTLSTMLGLARSHRLTAVIAQPPDLSLSLAAALENTGFSPNRLMQVFDATVWVNISRPPGEWEGEMRKVTRNRIRKATRLGVTIYEGADSDIPVFFDLMRSTCRRQGVSPSPSTLEAMTQLVRAFGQIGASRLTFAICRGEVVAGALDLIFGKRYTEWKKGWDGRHADMNPNVLLTYNSMRKARDLGCTCFDFGAMARPLAEALLGLQPLTEAQMKHYDFFKSGFGGRPQLLPPAMIYFPNPLLRFTHRQIAACPRLAARMKPFVCRL